MKKEIMDFISWDTRCFANAWLYIGVLIFFQAFNAYPDSLTNEQDGLIAFFKQAISAPPDVEEYTVREYAFAQQSFIRFAGARARSNYFLHALSDTDGASAPAASGTLFIAGRSGTNEYECSQNAISYGFGSNGLTGGIGAYFQVTRQFLDMGLGEIEPESVKWDGDTFTATNSNGAFQYDELDISNGLPSRLEVRVAKGSPPYKVIEYTYPNPPSSLNGFPEKMVISRVSDGTSNPHVGVQFYSVHLAAKPLSDKFFAPAQFVTANIIYTNIYSNSDVYAQLRRGKTVTMMKVPDALLKSDGYSNSRPRTIIFLCFAFITAIPIAYFIFISKQQNKLKTK